jgi:hypothetical protein
MWMWIVDMDLGVLESRCRPDDDVPPLAPIVPLPVPARRQAKFNSSVKAQPTLKSDANHLILHDRLTNLTTDLTGSHISDLRSSSCGLVKLLGPPLPLPLQPKGWRAVRLQQILQYSTYRSASASAALWTDRRFTAPVHETRTRCFTKTLKPPLPSCPFRGTPLSDACRPKLPACLPALSLEC